MYCLLLIDDKDESNILYYKFNTIKESGVDMLRVILRCLLLKCLKFKAIIILRLIYDCVLYELYLYSIVGIAIATADFRPI